MDTYGYLISFSLYESELVTTKNIRRKLRNKKLEAFKNNVSKLIYDVTTQIRRYMLRQIFKGINGPGNTGTRPPLEDGAQRKTSYAPMDTQHGVGRLLTWKTTPIVGRSVKAKR